MRALICLIACVPMTVWAEDFVLSSRVTDVTLYPRGAAILREAEFDIPAGQHRLIIPDLPGIDDPHSMRLQVEGVETGAVTFRESFLAPDGVWDRPDIKAAMDQRQAALDALNEVRDAVKRAEAEGQAARVQLEFLKQLGGTENAASAGAEALAAISDLVAQDAKAAHDRIIQSDILARDAARNIEILEHALELAELAVIKAIETEDDKVVVLVNVTADTDQSGKIRFSYISDHQAAWFPAYDVRVSETGETKVSLSRNAMVTQDTGETWTDVKLSMSTLEPAKQIEPRAPFGRFRRIEKPLEKSAQETDAYRAGNLAEPIVEPVVLVDETGVAYAYKSEGQGVTYTYPHPITLASGADQSKLKLGDLVLDAELIATAVPSRDQTAFLVAKVTNTSGEHILASPVSLQFVDGEYVGDSTMPTLPAGGEADLAFGPIQELRLKSISVDTGEGETGLFAKSNEKRTHRRLEIENLSTDKTWTVRVLDSVPYSEQDDLVIENRASPAPSEENVDDRRGILAWDVTIAPGATQVIDIHSTFSWPEGMELR